MKAVSLFLMRVSTGWLLVLWGVNKLEDVDHAAGVAQHFYLGIGSQALVLHIFGVLETLLGVLVVVGLVRRLAYPLTAVVLGLTALGVWKSILDPWGWVIEGTNVLFYPSLIVFAASLVLWGFMDEDRMSIDATRGR